MWYNYQKWHSVYCSISCEGCIEMTKKIMAIYYFVLFALAVYFHNLIGTGQTFWGSVFVGLVIIIGLGTALIQGFSKKKKCSGMSQ